MKLNNKEELLLEKVVRKIKEIDPEAIVKIRLDTVEDVDTDLLVYTDKSAIDILQNTVRLTTDILAEEGFHIGVLPMKKEAFTVA